MSRILDLLDAAPTDLPPRSGADRSLTAVATVLAVADDGRTVTVSLLGSGELVLPATAASWTDVATAHVLIDAGTGRPCHVLGPATAPASVEEQATATAEVKVVAAAAKTATTRTLTTTVTPTWSGTYRAGHGWDSWNVSRYGGRTDLYQGAVSGSGTMRGLALYGSRVTGLHADSITKAVLTLTGNGSARNSWPAVLQAASKTASGPSVSGATATVTVTGTSTVKVDVTALAPGLLSGLGIALVGGTYGAVNGTGASMSLALTYKKTS